jgi:hypothetical protein
LQELCCIKLFILECKSLWMTWLLF